MAKYKAYNYDQLIVLPISLANQLEAGTLEYTNNELVEKHIDLSVFVGQYHHDDTGAMAINPKNLLKAIFFSRGNGVLVRLLRCRRLKKEAIQLFETIVKSTGEQIEERNFAY